MMDKIIIQAPVDDDIGIAFDQTLGELKAIVEVYIEKYGEDAEYVINYHNEWVEENICIGRLETDSEYEKRINSIKAQENRERELYERLKAKYG